MVQWGERDRTVEVFLRIDKLFRWYKPHINYVVTKGNFLAQRITKINNKYGLCGEPAKEVTEPLTNGNSPAPHAGAGGAIVLTTSTCLYRYEDMCRW